MGVWDLVLQASLLVKLVLLFLVTASILCWTIVITKWAQLRKNQTENLKFFEIFWQSKNLDEVLEKSNKLEKSPAAAVFRSGFKELKKVSSSSSGSNYEIQNIERALERALNLEVSVLDKNVTWLASTASAAPFVGLFGTVWGIMNSFQGIGSTGSANLAVVAPGIAEALIATAFGLAAAIPAAIFYNHFVNQIRRMGIDLNSFSQDFLNIVQRNLLGRKK